MLKEEKVTKKKQSRHCWREFPGFFRKEEMESFPNIGLDGAISRLKCPVALCPGDIDQIPCFLAKLGLISPPHSL